MSTNISKQKREDLLNKIKEIRTFISVLEYSKIALPSLILNNANVKKY